MISNTMEIDTNLMEVRLVLFYKEHTHEPIS